MKNALSDERELRALLYRILMDFNVSNPKASIGITFSSDSVAEFMHRSLEIWELLCKYLPRGIIKRTSFVPYVSLDAPVQFGGGVEVVCYSENSAYIPEDCFTPDKFRQYEENNTVEIVKLIDLLIGRSDTEREMLFGVFERSLELNMQKSGKACVSADYYDEMTFADYVRITPLKTLLTRLYEADSLDKLRIFPQRAKLIIKKTKSELEEYVRFLRLFMTGDITANANAYNHINDIWNTITPEGQEGPEKRYFRELLIEAINRRIENAENLYDLYNRLEETALEDIKICGSSINYKETKLKSTLEKLIKRDENTSDYNEMISRLDGYMRLVGVDLDTPQPPQKYKNKVILPPTLVDEDEYEEYWRSIFEFWETIKGKEHLEKDVKYYLKYFKKFYR